METCRKYLWFPFTSLRHRWLFPSISGVVYPLAAVWQWQIDNL